MKSPGSPYPLAAAETELEEPAHLSSALIPGGREGRQGLGLLEKPPSSSRCLDGEPAAGAPPPRAPPPLATVPGARPVLAKKRESWRAESGIPLAPDQQAEAREERRGEAAEGEREDLDTQWREAWEERPGGKVRQRSRGALRGSVSTTRKEGEAEAGQAGFCGLEGMKDTWLEICPQGPLCPLMCHTHTLLSPQGQFR